MKIFRKIDENGYFVEDVVLEPTLNDKGEEVYPITDDLIEEPIPNDPPLHRPKWDGKKWVEGDFDAMLNGIKEGKIKLVDEVKRKYQHKPQPMQIDDNLYYFYSGRENVQKYKEAFDLAKNLGLDKGTIKVLSQLPENWDDDNALEEYAVLIEVNETQMQTALTTLGSYIYKVWLIAQQVKQHIRSVNEVDILTNINIEDIIKEQLQNGGNEDVSP